MVSGPRSGGRCGVTRSKRNPFKERCMLGAGHGGAHQWSSEPQPRVDDRESPAPMTPRVARSAEMVGG